MKNFALSEWIFVPLFHLSKKYYKNTQIECIFLVFILQIETLLILKFLFELTINCTFIITMKIKYNKKRIFLKMKKIFVCRQLHSHLHMAGNCIKKGFQLHSEWKNDEKKVKVFLHFFFCIINRI